MSPDGGRVGQARGNRASRLRGLSYVAQDNFCRQYVCAPRSSDRNRYQTTRSVGENAGSPASTVVIIINAPMAADLTSVAAEATSSASIDTPLFCHKKTAVRWENGPGRTEPKGGSPRAWATKKKQRDLLRNRGRCSLEGIQKRTTRNNTANGRTGTHKPEWRRSLPCRRSRRWLGSPTPPAAPRSVSPPSRGRSGFPPETPRGPRPALPGSWSRCKAPRRCVQRGQLQRRGVLNQKGGLSKGRTIQTWLCRDVLGVVVMAVA